VVAVSLSKRLLFFARHHLPPTLQSLLHQGPGRSGKKTNMRHPKLQFPMLFTMLLLLFSLSLSAQNNDLINWTETGDTQDE